MPKQKVSLFDLRDHLTKLLEELRAALLEAAGLSKSAEPAGQEEPAAGGEKEGKPSTVGSGHPGRECNRKAIERLNAGEGRRKNFETWCAEYEEETGAHPDEKPSGAEELYRKSVWERRKK